MGVSVQLTSWSEGSMTEMNHVTRGRREGGAALFQWTTSSIFLNRLGENTLFNDHTNLVFFSQN